MQTKVVSEAELRMASANLVTCDSAEWLYLCCALRGPVRGSGHEWWCVAPHRHVEAPECNSPEA